IRPDQLNAGHPLPYSRRNEHRPVEGARHEIVAADPADLICRHYERPLCREALPGEVWMGVRDRCRDELLCDAAGARGAFTLLAIIACAALGKALLVGRGEVLAEPDRVLVAGLPVERRRAV